MSGGEERMLRGPEKQSLTRQGEPVHLWPGMDLFCFALTGDAPGNCLENCEAREEILRIVWCRSGQMVWTAGSGDRVRLNPGNITLHSLGTLADSCLSLPTDACDGLALCVNTDLLSASPPEILAGGENLGAVLREKYGGDRCPLVLTEDTDAADLCSDLLDHAGPWRMPVRRLRALDLLLHFAEMETESQKHVEEFTQEQVEIARRVHEELLRHMDRRITIEELSRKYLMNPTTLKAVFKSVYGNSLAAHIREHRMEQAAKLLRGTDRSVAEIARSVGYDSQSRFTEAFKAVYHVLPREYRRQT